MAAKKLCLIDAFNQIHRAYHALPELTTAQGVPTNATYGFTTILRKLLQEESPDYIAVVFDPGGKTVRHEQYADYKSSRSAMPDDLRAQVPWVRKVIEAMNVTMVELSGYEADDVIGTLASQATAAGIDTIIASEDKDLLQLVNNHVRLRSDRNQVRVYDEGAVEEKYGVVPGQMADLLGLMGDSVDDIPGVPGVGPKRARELIQAYGSVEGAIDHAEELSRYKYGRNLAEFADQAVLSKQLATIHTDLELPVSLDDLATADADRSAVRDLFMELEFRRLIDDYSDEPEAASGSYETIADAAGFLALLQAARAAGRLTLVLQTDHPEPIRANIVGLGVAIEPGTAGYLPLGHQGLTAANAMTVAECLELLGPVLADPEVKLIGHDLKRTLITLAHHGVPMPKPALDTMLASYVLHPTRQSHDLEALALDILRLDPTKLADVLPDKKATFDTVPIPEATGYAAERADVALRIAAAFEVELESQAGLHELFETIEMPLARVLARMEWYGVRIDSSYLSELSAEFTKRIDELQASIYEAAGMSFNINSPKQLGEVLFDRLELPAGGKTAKSGNRSTKAEVLEALAADFPIAGQVIEFREATKLKSTYLDALPTYVFAETGRVHASFDQAVAATGRLSSSNPNLQNIPIRTATGRQIRQAFVPNTGSVLLVADYSQIELRLMAHLSGDPELQRAFREGFDIHRATAAAIFHVEPDDVSYEQRDRAKVINFGVLYGMGPQRLAREFEVSVKEAKEFIEKYKSAYPKVGEYLDKTVEQAKEEGLVTTLLGRVRHLPELQSGRPMVRAFGERIAVNTPLQGTAADLIKLAMVNLDRRFTEENIAARMTIQVHDELVFEVDAEEIDQVAEIVRAEMEGAISLDVPLVVDVGVGATWMDAKG
ncbi:MAG: DNA polymerase I [Acidobacteria bacterium]|nr:DNA polymerase I [Acidobacteriota bacterium]